MKQIRFLAAALAAAVLLSGCQSGSSGSSGSSASASVPASASASIPDASSTSSSANSVISGPEASGSAVFTPTVTWEGNLMRFPMGNLSVTAESLEAAEGGHSTILTIYESADSMVPLQTLTTESPEGEFGEDCLLVTDANFDGFLDLGWKYVQADANCWYRFWLWDSGSGQFEEETAFAQDSTGSGGICAPEFDPARKTVIGHRRDSAAESDTVRRQILLTADPATGTPHLSVLEPDGSDLSEVFALDGDTAPDEADQWSDLDQHPLNPL